MPSTKSEPAHSTFEPLLDRVATWVRNLSLDGRAETGFAGYDCDEFARIARDAGVSTGELLQLVRKGPHAADLLPKMMVALGLDPAAVDRKEPEVMHDLQRLCSLCGHKRECAHDLAAGQGEQRYHDYCLNAATLDALREESAT